MIDFQVLITAFLTGLFGATHCVSMCGGIACLLSSQLAKQSPRQRLLTSINFNLGRIVSYTIAGLIVSGSVQNLLNLHQSTIFLQGLQWFAGLMMILLGLHLTRWVAALSWLEKLGARLWQHISPKASQLLATPSIARSLPLGVLWGWLPCGLVYSTLILSASQAHWLQGGLVMLCFGLGTFSIMALLTLLGGTVLAHFKHRIIQIASGLFVIALGIAQVVK